LLRSTPAHAAVQVGVLSVALLVASLALRALFPESTTTQKAFPFMFLLGGLGLAVSVWLVYFREQRSNGATALFVLANMALIALLILPYALLTRDFRRANDVPRGARSVPPVPPEWLEPPPGGFAPAELPALRYLPGDGNLIVGVHVADLQRDPAGKEFLEGPSWGPVEAALAQVERWTGLKKEGIDHVVLGVGTDRLLPRVTVVVRTRAAYQPQSFGVVL
jgi:hypothetical protein